MNSTAVHPSPGPSRSARPDPPSRQEWLEGRFGMRMAAHLGEAADTLPHEITERLRVARERALDRARQAHPVATAAAAPAAAARRSRPEGAAPLWMRLAGWLPLVLLILGLIQIQWTGDQEQIDVAAEIDSELLADELPPQAYGDPGFVHFLNRPSEQE